MSRKQAHEELHAYRAANYVFPFHERIVALHSAREEQR